MPKTKIKDMLKNVWVCVLKKDNLYDIDTFSSKKSVSISKFIEKHKQNWRWSQNVGWECLKVEIEIIKMFH